MDQSTLSILLSIISLATSLIGLLLAIFRRLHACSCFGVACLFKSSLHPPAEGYVAETPV
jgi:hypothetical protein